MDTVVNHLGQCVTDADRSRAFYEAVFGFRHWFEITLPDQPLATLVALPPPLGVRAVYLLVTQQLIGRPGLSGFAPADGGDGSLFLLQLLGFIDLYLIWYALLLITGVRAGDQLSRGKAAVGVVVTLVVLLLLQALPGFGLAKLGSLTVIRPFLF